MSGDLIPWWNERMITDGAEDIGSWLKANSERMCSGALALKSRDIILVMR